jgi:hypothetical protein
MKDLNFLTSLVCRVGYGFGKCMAMNALPVALPVGCPISPILTMFVLVDVSKDFVHLRFSFPKSLAIKVHHRPTRAHGRHL